MILKLVILIGLFAYLLVEKNYFLSLLMGTKGGRLDIFTFHVIKQQNVKPDLFFPIDQEGLT